MPETLFQKLNCRLDPWQSDYGMGYRASQETEDQAWSQDEIRCSIEVPEESWTPVPAAANIAKAYDLVFVDGVRRIHTRIIQEKDSLFYFGAIGSLAAGAVRIQQGHINSFNNCLVLSSVKHALLLAHCGTLKPKAFLPLNYPAGASLELLCEEIGGRDPEEAVNFLQQLMREEEASIIRGLAEIQTESPAVIVADGPLNLRLLESASAVGYIKTLHSLYLPDHLQSILWHLSVKERTPIFLIQPEDWEENRVVRYSCYLRIASPTAKQSIMSGLVRLEISASIPLEEAKDMFDRCTFSLADFASPWGRDPRAPQNLIPLAALEIELRRRIGHPRLLQRIFEDQF